jgi:hypothetical protein
MKTNEESDCLGPLAKHELRVSRVRLPPHDVACQDSLRFSLPGGPKAVTMRIGAGRNPAFKNLLIPSCVCVQQLRQRVIFLHRRVSDRNHASV